MVKVYLLPHVSFLRFGQSRDEKIAKPTPLSDVNGRETGSKGAKNEPKGKDDAILQVARPTLDTKSIDPKCSMETTKRLAELERREQAVSAKEEQLNLRELQLLRLEAKVNVSTSQTSQERVPWKADRDFGTHLPEKSEKDVATSSEVIRVQGMQGVPTAAKPDLADRGVSPRELSAPTTQVSAETLSADFERLQQARIDAWEAQQRVAKATEHVALAEAHTQDAAHPQGRLEYSQRLAEKRKELERWQKALEERSKALEELEKSLSDAGRQALCKGKPSQWVWPIPCQLAGRCRPCSLCSSQSNGWSWLHSLQDCGSRSQTHVWSCENRRLRCLSVWCEHICSSSGTCQ